MVSLSRAEFDAASAAKREGDDPGSDGVGDDCALASWARAHTAAAKKTVTI